MLSETEHLLTCLAEECSEVAHRVSKALRFGLKEIEPGKTADNATRIAAEVTDLLAIVDMLEERGVLKASREFTAKKEKVLHCMEYANQVHALTRVEPIVGGVVVARQVPQPHSHPPAVPYPGNGHTHAFKVEWEVSYDIARNLKVERVSQRVFAANDTEAIELVLAQARQANQTIAHPSALRVEG